MQIFLAHPGRVIHFYYNCKLRSQCVWCGRSKPRSKECDLDTGQIESVKGGCREGQEDVVWAAAASSGRLVLSRLCNKPQRSIASFSQVPTRKAELGKAQQSGGHVHAYGTASSKPQLFPLICAAHISAFCLALPALISSVAFQAALQSGDGCLR